MKNHRKNSEFVCHIVSSNKQSNTQIRNPTSPIWAHKVGISWRSPENLVTASHEGSVIRLILQDVTSDSKEIEWNPSTCRIILRRNELWSKPFYFYIKNNELIVTDSLRLIIKILPNPPQINIHALDTYLALEFFPAPLTPFNNVLKVGVEETCYLDLSTEKIKWITNTIDERISVSFEQGLCEVVEALNEVIQRCIHQCPEKLILLCSGGLDSTILAHFMHGQGQAIVLSYINSWKDEAQRARHTSSQARLPLQEIHLPQFSLEQFCRYVGLLDEPLGGTCGYAISHLCASVPYGAWIVGGHGTGALSLMNVNHIHLRDALNFGPQETLVERFSQLVTYLDADTRQRLLEIHSHSTLLDPIKVMIERELPVQNDIFKALQAVIRRQLCVAEETSQFWPIFESFGHTPVMPFFEKKVRRILDRLPENILRNNRYERRLLNELAKQYCPGYEPQPLSLGCGLPLGLKGYPNEHNMKETIENFSNGPLSEKVIYKFFDSSKKTEGGQKFFWLRRLWTVILLHAWLEQNMKSYPDRL